MFKACPLWLPLGSAFGLTLLMMPAMRFLAMRWGCVSLPRSERWHRRPTPFLGGVAFFVRFLLPALLCSPHLPFIAPLLLITTLMFLVGIYDDCHQINPTTKLIGQIIVTAVALASGYMCHFFTWPLF